VNAARLRLAAILAVAAAAWAVYAYGALHSPLLDPALREQRAYIDRVLHESKLDPDEERRLADLYWSRYPDVAADANFGRAGAMGVLGAREHFNRHGRREGRVWGIEPKP